MFLAKRKSNFELEREFKFRLNALKVSDNYFRVNLWQLRRGECLFESEREREIGREGGRERERERERQGERVVITKFVN